MYTELANIYTETNSIIEGRLKEFNSVRKRWDNREIFIELCFCLLTPQSKARNADIAIKNLVDSDKLFLGTEQEISEYLSIIRFKNNKAKYIVLLRDMYFREDKSFVIDILESDITIFEKRKMLVNNIKGIAFKEASHFLRNIGFYNDVTILDRHILRNLLEFNVIDEIPKTISEKKYLDIENRMMKFSKKINIPLKSLDFVIWYKATNDIFK